MLAEAAASSAATPPPQPYIGRRKVSEEPPDQSPASAPSPIPEQALSVSPHLSHQPQHVAYDEFEDSEDDDAEFEDVDLDAAQESVEMPEQRSLQLDLSTPFPASRRVMRRKVASGAERRLRLDVHKAHLLLLLGALRHRNQWCESEQVQAILKPLVFRKTISLIHADDAKPQAERSRSFLRGIEEICKLWRGLWTTTERGMKRAHWRDDIDLQQEVDLIEEAVDFDSFKSAAQTRRGSRDLGAQLFCALLRSVAVDTRLVCSLQVLPFSAVAKGQTPERPKSSYEYAPDQDFGSSSSFTHARNKVVESPYPIYWVEVFSPATTAWVPLDPLVRDTMNKPRTAFEPPASDLLNSLCYVIAFEDDGSAKDVTLRYTTHFNSKTRKSRVESTKGGEDWWARVMVHFEKPLPEVRDELEDADFLKREAQEGMPKNIADFKGHPVYVLERHLRRNEVIHPQREVGKATVGGGDRKKLESVFRRRDVHLCRTADAWYRRGRDVREGMEPLKYAAPRTRLEKEEVGGDDEDTDVEGMALYAEYQTEVYVPPPVVSGRIPKNKFGNLDVYVESMIPPGAIHVRHPLASKAAQVLGISFADAVTGFEFKGRQGTAVINGAVISADQRIGIVAVVVGLQTQMLEEIETERSRITLSVWRRWLHALRIRERIEQEYGSKEGQDKIEPDEPDDDEDSNYQDDEHTGGGFMPDPDQGAATVTHVPNDIGAAFGGKKLALTPLPPLPTQHEIIVIESPHKLPKPKPSAVAEPPVEVADHKAGGSSLAHDEVANHGAHTGAGDYTDDNVDGGGGFMLEEDMDTGGGGGFLPEEDSGDKLDMPLEPSDAKPVLTPDFHRYLTDNSSAPLEETAPQSEDQLKSLKMHDASLQLSENTAQNMMVQTLKPTTAAETATSTILPPLRANNDLQLGTRADGDQDQDLDEKKDSDSLGGGSDTSMLSHDPAEEDAEPEWLLDSLS